jgi:phosphoribosyl 1,2-cyclic phosphate phosphodiesterase
VKVTVLGCGTSSGVPVIGCDCAVCRSDDPRNRRLRCSVLVEAHGQRLLVDTSPDFREQALRAGIRGLDAILYTHAHADHVHGIDDLRALNFLQGRPIEAWGDPEVLAQIQSRFAYAFQPPSEGKGWWRPALVARPFDGPFRIGPVEVIPFPQLHGRSTTWGFRIGRFAYTSDASDLPEETFRLLDGVEVWIVDCLRERPHISHAHLELTLAWIARVRPRLAVLTHMNHEVDHAAWTARLPEGVAVGHDGMELLLEDEAPYDAAE